MSVGQDKAQAEATRALGVTERLREFKWLQKENERLRRAVSALTLDKLVLAEAAEGNV